MIYMNILERVIDQKNAGLVLLKLWTVRVTDSKGVVFWYSSPDGIQTVCGKLDISPISFRDYLTKLVASKLLVRLSNGVYRFDPDFVRLMNHLAENEKKQ